MPWLQYGPGHSALFSLDETRRMHRREWVAWATGIVSYAAIIVVVISQGAATLPQLLWVPVVHALVLAIVCAFTGVLILGQARSSGQRGYLWLGGTYLYVAGVLFLFPLLFPDAFGSDGPMLGGAQSSISLFYAWHIAFLIGLITSILVLRADQRSHRRPGLGLRARGVLVIVGLLAVLTIVAAAGEPLELIAPTGDLTALAQQLDVLTVALSAVAVLLAALSATGGAQVHRWLLAVTLLLAGEAVVNLFSAGRWTVAWYFDRLFGMIAMATLFAVLLLIIARLGRDTNELAVSDSLTGCESRASFTMSLDRELASARQTGEPRALLWVDLDGFKSVNDQLGHGAGDEVLVHAVQRIQSQVRAGDHVGRLGGDEFGVLLCDSVADIVVADVAERILTRLREPIIVAGGPVLLSASLGIATTADGGHAPAELLHHADLAMYAAKNAGGDRYHRFSGQLGTEALGRAELRHRLSHAIRQQDFDLDFQPIVDLSDGRTVAVEALVRWKDDGARIPALDFVGFASESGQIISIGRVVLACLETDLPTILPLLPSDGFVSFNLSVKELVDYSILERLENGPLAANASRLVVEVTESLEMQSLAEAEHNLAVLRACGYRVALDDFGAGFSNFARLEQLNPHILKLDRSLVARAGSGQQGGAAFLAAAVSVADSLTCRLVAEGVETAYEHMVVRDLGIEMAQGYLFDRPAPCAQWAAANAGPILTD